MDNNGTRAYVCRNTCQAYSRRRKFRVRCSSCAVEGGRYCFFHTKFPPHFSRNREINAPMKELFDREQFDQPEFLDYCLRIVKDNSRHVQVPISTDYTQVRVSPSEPFVVFLVVQRPAGWQPDETEQSFLNNQQNLVWPLKFVVTNVLRRTRRGDRNRLVFDVISFQYGLQKLPALYGAFFEVFFKRMAGYQIFNCQVGHYAHNLALSVRLLPTIVSNLAAAKSTLQSLCTVNYLAWLAFRARINEKRDRNPPALPSPLQIASMVFLRLSTLRSRADNLKTRIFRRRTLFRRPLFLSDLPENQRYPDMVRLVRNSYPAYTRTYLDGPNGLQEIGGFLARTEAEPAQPALANPNERILQRVLDLANSPDALDFSDLNAEWINRPRVYEQLLLDIWTDDEEMLELWANNNNARNAQPRPDEAFIEVDHLLVPFAGDENENANVNEAVRNENDERNANNENDEERNANENENENENENDEGRNANENENVEGRNANNENDEEGNRDIRYIDTNDPALQAFVTNAQPNAQPNAQDFPELNADDIENFLG